MPQNYSNIVAGDDGCYKKLYEDARDAYRKFIADGAVIPEGTINITQNGEAIDVAQYASANVDVPSSGGNLTNLSVDTFHHDHPDVYTPQAPYDGFESVTVDAVQALADEYNAGEANGYQIGYAEGDSTGRADERNRIAMDHNGEIVVSNITYVDPLTFTQPTTLNVTDNGEYYATGHQYFDTVYVDVPNTYNPGTQKIYVNGVYNNEGYESINVNVPTSPATQTYYNESHDYQDSPQSQVVAPLLNGPTGNGYLMNQFIVALVNASDPTTIVTDAQMLDISTQQPMGSSQFCSFVYDTTTDVNVTATAKTGYVIVGTFGWYVIID